MEKHPDASPFFECTISLKGESQGYKKKVLIYERCICSQEDPIIAELISEAKEECRFEIEEVKIRASF
jgi:hypothetical protein